MIYDLGILKGKIYLNDHWFHGNLYIKDGIIAAMSKAALKCKNEYDCNGNWVLPGFIDPHVHFELDLGKYKSADDFESGSKCAAMGGITTVIDFLKPVKNRDELRGAFAQRLLEAEKSCVDYSFHTTLCGLEDDIDSFIDDSRLLGIPTIKMFTTYSSSDRRTGDKTVFKLIEKSSEKKILPLIHAENDGFITEKGVSLSQHEESRPSISEITEVLKIAEFTEYTGGRAYIVHVSSGLTVQKVKKKYRNKINKNIFLESCPHYFYFNNEKYGDEGGELYTMAPPLRSEDERILLINSFENIDTIGTDHCNFMKEEKKGEYTENIPMGVGGIETSFQSMFTIFGEEAINRFTINPAKIHGLYPSKGTLNIGSQADVVIFNPHKRSVVETHYKSDYDLYSGNVLNGEVLSTIIKGRFVKKDGEFIGGKGTYIGRELSIW